MIRFRQKFFDEVESNPEKKKSSNLLLKGGLAVGALVGGQWAARKGLFGTGIQMSANNLWGKAGKSLQEFGHGKESWLGNFAKKRGDNMTKSASKEWGLAKAQSDGQIVKGASDIRNGVRIRKNMREFDKNLYGNTGTFEGYMASKAK